MKNKNIVHLFLFVCSFVLFTAGYTQTGESVLSHTFKVDIGPNIITNTLSPSTQRFAESIKFDTKNTDLPADTMLVVKSAITEFRQRQTIEKNWLKLYTNSYGELFFSLYNGGPGFRDTYKNIYRLFYTRAKLVQGSNILKIDFYEKGQIWVTCNAGNVKENLISGKQYGEGLLWHIDTTLQDISNFTYPTSTTISTSHLTTERTTIKRALSYSDFTKDAVYNNYYDANQSHSLMPKTGNTYLIQNKVSGKYLMINHRHMRLYQSDLGADPVAFRESFVWQPFFLNDTSCRILNLFLPGRSMEAGGLNGGGVAFNPHTFNLAQQWTFIPDKDGYFYIKNIGLPLNQVLDNRNWDGYDEVIHKTAINAEYQKWRFVPWSGNLFRPTGFITLYPDKLPNLLSAWSYDPDLPSQTLRHKIIADGDIGHPIALIKTASVNNLLNFPKRITGAHEFEYTIPARYHDGLRHEFTVYAVDATDSTSAELIDTKKFVYTPCKISANPTAANIFTSTTYFPGSLKYNFNDSSFYGLSKMGNNLRRLVKSNGELINSSINPFANFINYSFDKNGTIWGVSINTKQLHYVHPESREVRPTKTYALKIACSPKHLYFAIIGLDNKVYTYDPLHDIALLLPGNREAIAIEIAVDASGTIWCIDEFKNIYFYNKASYNWHKLLGPAAKGTNISCGVDGSVFWIKNFTVYKWDGLENGLAVNTSAKLKQQIAVMNSYQYAVVSDGYLYLQDCSNQNKPVNQLPGALEKTPDLSIESNSERLQMYPNPASTQLTISYLPLATSDVQFAITDISGRSLLTRKLFARKGQKINCTFTHLKEKKIAAGVYLVSVISKSETFVRKIIVE